MSHYEDDTVTLHHGDSLAVAKTLTTGSVQTIVTSPPYFGLRDYGNDGQMGAESSLEEYVAGMVALFHELRRVLADDGTLWLNLGDSYSTQGGNLATGKSGKDFGKSYSETRGRAGERAGMPDKNLLGIPWRVALALQADGWILRSDIIWAKPNPMPESVTDRPTKSHEYIFLLAKSARYFYDSDSIRETYSGDRAASRRARSGKVNKENSSTTPWIPNDEIGANKRTVWSVATQPFPGSHFAVYPPELIRPCILAGSRIGDTVLDPFSGSGTTGMVATQEGRKYIGIDLNKDYLDLSLRTRFAQPALNMEVTA